MVQAGPFLDAAGEMCGSLVIIDVVDQEAADAWAAGDPYAKRACSPTWRSSPGTASLADPKNTASLAIGGAPAPYAAKLRGIARDEILAVQIRSLDLELEQQVAKGDAGEPWEGVRNYQARNNMREMEIGDRGFFYLSQKEKAVVGVVEVIATSHPDATTDDPRWDCVDIKAVGPFEHR